MPAMLERLMLMLLGEFATPPDRTLSDTLESARKTHLLAVSYNPIKAQASIVLRFPFQPSSNVRLTIHAG